MITLTCVWSVCVTAVLCVYKICDTLAKSNTVTVNHSTDEKAQELLDDESAKETQVTFDEVLATVRDLLGGDEDE